MAVPWYAEDLGSPKEKWGEGGSLIATRILRCLWADRYDVLYEVGKDGGQQYPHQTAVNCFARGATILGEGKITEYAENMAQYEHAVLTVIYSTEAPQGVGGKRFVTEEMTPARFDRRMQVGSLLWDDANGDIVSPDESPHFSQGATVYVLTFHDLLAIPPGALLQNVSNNAPVPCFLYPLTFPTETLRHLTAITTRTVGLGLQGHYRLQYRWTYNEKTWSKFQKADGTWHEIYSTISGATLKPYPPINFATMYPP